MWLNEAANTRLDGSGSGWTGRGGVGGVGWVDRGGMEHARGERKAGDNAPREC